MAQSIDLSKLAGELRAAFEAADAANKRAAAELDDLREAVARIELAIDASKAGAKPKTKPAGPRQALFYCAIYCADGGPNTAHWAQEADVRAMLATLRLDDRELEFGTLWASAKERAGEDFIRSDDGPAYKLAQSGVVAIRAHLGQFQNIPSGKFGELSAK